MVKCNTEKSLSFTRVNITYLGNLEQEHRIRGDTLKSGVRKQLMGLITSSLLCF